VKKRRKRGKKKMEGRRGGGKGRRWENRIFIPLTAYLCPVPTRKNLGPGR